MTPFPFTPYTPTPSPEFIALSQRVNNLEFTLIVILVLLAIVCYALVIYAKSS